MQFNTVQQLNGFFDELILTRTADWIALVKVRVLPQRLVQYAKMLL